MIGSGEADIYFKSAIEYVRRQVNDLNYRLISEDWVDLNEFYYSIGLGPCKAGHEFGWNIGYNGQIEIKMIPRLIERNGVERTVIYLDYNACHNMTAKHNQNLLEYYIFSIVFCLTQLLKCLLINCCTVC